VSEPNPCLPHPGEDLRLDPVGETGTGGEAAGPKDGHPVCQLCSQGNNSAAGVTKAYPVPAGLGAKLMVFRALLWRGGKPCDLVLCQPRRLRLLYPAASTLGTFRYMVICPLTPQTFLQGLRVCRTLEGGRQTWRGKN
jgi:hypothetical protein